MAETFYNGSDQILYLVVGGIDCPIACLTDNGFSENVEMLETTTVDNNGWKTSRPLNQSFTISFSGVQIVTDATTPTRYSLDTLRVLKRSRTRVEWKIATGAVFSESGEGYITELSETGTADGLLTFSGTIVGYGSPVDTTSYIFDEETDYIFNN